MSRPPASSALSAVLGAPVRLGITRAEPAGTALCPVAVGGLRTALSDEPEFVATLATTLGDHEGLRPAVRRPA